MFLAEGGNIRSEKFAMQNLGDKSRGLLGDNKRDDNPLFGTFWTHISSVLRWLKVAQSGSKWLKMA